MLNSRYGQPTASTELECKVQTLQIEDCLSPNSRNSRYGQPTARTELECKVQTLQIEDCLSPNSRNFSTYLSIILKFMLLLRVLSFKIEMITFLSNHCNIHGPVPDHDVYQLSSISVKLLNKQIINRYIF
jgi:hypothetical protein